MDYRLNRKLFRARNSGSEKVRRQNILQLRSGNIVFEFATVDLASNFPQIPEKLVVAPIAPNTKEAGFEEFALSIDGTFDCPVRP